MARKPANYPFPTKGAVRVAVDAALVEGFTEIYLLDRFDNPQPIPNLHRTLWDMFCSDHPQVAVAAPRGHAKSSAGTHAFGLTSLLFGASDFSLLVGATEGMAAKHLAEMAVELSENHALIQEFSLKILTQNETELVVRCGGREFCVMAKGAGQKVRGIKWRQKRPDLILIDDLEDDEAVMNFERRDKLAHWLTEALFPCGSDTCRIRMVGTILHLDSQLERFMNDPEWLTARFRAHEAFDDFSNILWPEKFTEQRLRRIRQGYISQGNASGYSQEYLSCPIAEVDAYFRRGDLRPMEEGDYSRRMVYFAGADFAISTSQRADNTCFVVGGMDSDGELNIVEVIAKKMESPEIISTMIDLQEKWGIEHWIAERGAIEKAIGPFLRNEMLRRNVILAIEKVTPSVDKPTRAKAFQSRARIGGVKVDKKAEWYAAYEDELLSFPRGIHDDRVDGSAYLGMCIDKFWNALTDDEVIEGEWEVLEREEAHGRSLITGY